VPIGVVTLPDVAPTIVSPHMEIMLPLERFVPEIGAPYNVTMGDGRVHCVGVVTRVEEGHAFVRLTRVTHTHAPEPIIFPAHYDWEPIDEITRVEATPLPVPNTEYFFMNSVKDLEPRPEYPTVWERLLKDD